MFRRSPIACLIYLFLGSIVAIEISSKIDFGSDDASGSDSSSDDPEPAVIVVGGSRNDDRRKIGGFGSSRPRARSSAGVRGPDRPIISLRNCSDKPQPPRTNSTKNIYIFVDGEVEPENFNCRDGVCETILSKETDDGGNVIGTVRLTIVAKPKDPKVEDVPVIDGIRGTGYDNRNPTFNHERDPSPHSTFFDNDIPQAPTNRKGPIPRRNPVFGPQSGSPFHRRNFGARNEPPVWIPMIPDRGSVDDKIEAPLSRTNPREQ